VSFQEFFAASQIEYDREDARLRAAEISDSESHLAVAIAYLRLRPRGAPGETLAFNDELTLGRISLGRAALEDVKMSRQHARFYFEGDGRVWVQDLSSTNGTFVNGARIDRPCRLALGDNTAQLDDARVGRCIRRRSGALEHGRAAPVPNSPGPQAQPRRPLEGAENAAAGLPPFPNYTQIPSLLSIRRWWVVRGPAFLRPGS